ncbi:hypothetical protein QUB75_30510 [Microcoleus sp. K1-B6]|uniref:hypothetical protein n=1 Tax=unclassified Microcoleus TaxID=2642155 RepID=UPI002FD4C247
MVKKDRQQNYYTIAYSKKYVTNILLDSFTKTTDANPVYFTHNLFEPDRIRETSNDRTNRVSINHLLVNNLLPDRPFPKKSIAPSTKNPIAHPPKNPIAHFSQIRSPHQQKTRSPIHQKT